MPSPQTLAEGKPHGTRIKYLGGCRCVPCRAANSRYSCEMDRRKRMGWGNPLVPAARARKHIAKLSRHGIGRRTVSQVSGIGMTTVQEIRAGIKTQIRRRTETAILSVGKESARGTTLVSARETWRLVEKLLAEGFTKAELAARLGKKRRALQLRKDRITVNSAKAVRRFYRMIMME